MAQRKVKVRRCRRHAGRRAVPGRHHCWPCCQEIDEERRRNQGLQGAEIEAAMDKILQDELRMPWERGQP